MSDNREVENARFQTDGGSPIFVSEMVQQASSEAQLIRECTEMKLNLKAICCLA